MNRLEYAHEVWRQNEGYAIPETCQVFQDNFDSGIIYYNCNKYKNNENYLQLELDQDCFLVTMKIDNSCHGFPFDTAIEACVKYNNLMTNCLRSWHKKCREKFLMAIDTQPRRIYLDDIRNPQTEGFTVLRSYQEFVDFTLMFGCPEYISFDHDLGNDLPSGHDCLQWLIERDLRLQIQKQKFISDNFEINVHSANPVGKENIEKLWISYKNFKINS